ncbi:MAG: isochorismatase family protein, partial [Deltaproteobacteria bacterium]|nr:isochorismatase family protein [Deltaproteobacteria bacterium]
YGRQYEVVPPFLSLDLNRHHYPCHPKSWGSKLVEPVAKAFEARPEGSHEQVIEKHTYDGFFQTELLSFLIKHRVRTAVLVGAETQICVFATAKSAALHQFNTVIVEDGVWTSREDLGAGALTIFLEAYGSTAGSPAILEPKPHA